jgi:NAD(P)H dehydrogenase (quinone)
VRASLLLAHPKAGSFNHALAAAAAAGLVSAGFDVVFHDLYSEGFAPAMQAEEVDTSTFADDLAAEHAREIVEASRIVVVHPSWFFNVPAMAKGWVDRVVRQGVAFEMRGERIVGLLHAESALVVTTGNAARSFEVQVLGDPLTTFWRECVFVPAGVASVQHFAFGPVRGSSEAERRGWLARVQQTVSAWT